MTSQLIESQVLKIFDEWEAEDIPSIKKYLDENIEEPILAENGYDSSSPPALAAESPTLNKNISPLDEMKIKCHIIKKNKSCLGLVPAIKPNTYGSFPLLIEDILKIQVEEDNTFKKVHSLFGVNFKIVVFYGRLSFLKARETSYQKTGYYQIDDGTGTINVHYNHKKPETLKIGRRLDDIEREIRLQRNNLYWKYKKYFNDLLVILNKSKVQTFKQKEYFKTGEKAVCFGSPFKFMDEIRVFAFEMYPNSTCDYEVYFKNLLFNVYCTNFSEKLKNK